MKNQVVLQVFLEVEKGTIAVAPEDDGTIVLGLRADQLAEAVGFQRAQDAATPIRGASLVGQVGKPALQTLARDFDAYAPLLQGDEQKKQQDVKRFGAVVPGQGDEIAQALKIGENQAGIIRGGRQHGKQIVSGLRKDLAQVFSGLAGEIGVHRNTAPRFKSSAPG